jgi:hypothetical protein
MDGDTTAPTVVALGYLGIRVADPAAYAATVAMLRDVLRLPVVRDDGESSVRFGLPDGAGIDIYGPDDEDHRFYGDGPCVGLRVADVDAARALLEAAGVRFRWETERAESAAWAHFEGPDGGAWELIGPA